MEFRPQIADFRTRDGQGDEHDDGTQGDSERAEERALIHREEKTQERRDY